MSRDVTIPAKQVTEEISNITEVPGYSLRFTVGTGEVVEGVFMYTKDQHFGYIELERDLYRDFRSKHPVGYALGDLWEYVDAIRSGAVTTAPNKYATWDSTTNTWIDPLDILDLQKADAVLEVDSSAGVKILAIYPFYKQHNVSRTPLSEEALAMYAYIDGIRSLAQVAKATISIATSAVEISRAVDSFILALSNT